MSVTTSNDIDLHLASGSPRRAEFLKLLGIRFDVTPANIDESVLADEAASDYVRRLALEKAEQISASINRSCPVLGADTAVVVDDRILGKPDSLESAREMLGLLSGRWHEVYTGVALVARTADLLRVRTRVKFRAITSAEIEQYYATGEPHDKAGAYAVQGLGGAFVERLDGSYSNVVGLPLVETGYLLDEHGIAHILKPRE